MQCADAQPGKQHLRDTQAAAFDLDVPKHVAESRHDDEQQQKII